MKFNEMIAESILDSLDVLSMHNRWGCPQCSVCEEQDNGGESRYCLPLIEAALLEKDEFDTYHKQ